MGEGRALSNDTSDTCDTSFNKILYILIFIQHYKKSDIKCHRVMVGTLKADFRGAIRGGLVAFVAERVLLVAGWVPFVAEALRWNAGQERDTGAERICIYLISL